MAIKGSVRIWYKKQLRLEPLTFPQRQMVEVGSAGLLSVFQRLSAAQGPEDGPSRPLTKRYAIRKSRMGRGNRRNLFLSGEMLGSLKLRTVTDNRAYASVGANMRAESRTLTKWYARRKFLRQFRPAVQAELLSRGGPTRKLTNKDVAWINQRREPWLVFSPKNKQAVLEKFNQILRDKAKQMIVSKVAANG